MNITHWSSSRVRLLFVKDFSSKTSIPVEFLFSEVSSSSMDWNSSFSYKTLISNMYVSHFLLHLVGICCCINMWKEKILSLNLVSTHWGTILAEIILLKKISSEEVLIDSNSNRLNFNCKLSHLLLGWNFTHFTVEIFFTNSKLGWPKSMIM